MKQLLGLRKSNLLTIVLALVAVSLGARWVARSRSTRAPAVAPTRPKFTPTETKPAPRHASRARREVSPAFRSAIAIVVITISSTFGWQTTEASFNATTQNPSNALASGTVIIADNDAGGSVINLTGLTPNSSGSGCIQVTYTGSLAANVTLYGSVTSTLSASSTLTVQRGTISSGAFNSCANFTADSTVYIAGQASGVVYSGSPSSYPSSFGTGITDPTAGSPASWTNSTTVAYKFEVWVADDYTSYNKSISITPTWEAQQS